ncbi:MAG: hypothetical protein LBL09_03605 [Oscillospiraceae bacterium]|jgi:hypothetical protein|nr:hypothetical protein [Oscillospiraceae bacterium]
MSYFNVVKCQICGRQYQSSYGKICSRCLDDIEIAFGHIRDYMYDNRDKNISVEDILENIEVSEKIVLHLMKEKRLELKSVTGNTGLFCQVCKKPISSGTMCGQCDAELKKSIISVLPKTQPPPQTAVKEEKKERGGAKMHIRSDQNR